VPDANAASDAPSVRFFRSARALRRWLATHAESERELWVGFYTKQSGKGGLTYSEALEEALCFGWIDGVRKKAGADGYMQRFSPRRAHSTWSAANLRRMDALLAAARVTAAGMRVFEARNPERDGYAIADRAATFSAEHEQTLRANKRAWRFFEAQPPWYRRNAAYWVSDAKQEPTRQRRLATLIAACKDGRRVDSLDPATAVATKAAS
jgi:uncharacterized protein YdeI (YjbR/CyaY-like superfamily)